MARSKVTRAPAARTIGAWAQSVPVSVDIAGLLYCQAVAQIRRGSTRTGELESRLDFHAERLARATTSASEDAAEDLWVDVIRGVGSLESLFGRVIRELVSADFLLVASAEAFVNDVAAHVLTGNEFGMFDKLNPVAKWLFLPRLMKLKWRPRLASAPLQAFEALVARRNRIAHPRPVRIDGVADVRAFLRRCQLDAKSATLGAESVKGLIRQLSLSWVGSYGPDWLEPSHARRRPPCFAIGPPEGRARLGRNRRVK
jgi:hypothetical protein